MKKIYVSLILSFCLAQGYSQNLSNPSFEEHYIGAIDRVFHWITSDGFRFAAGQVGDTILPLLPHTQYDAEGFLFSEVLLGLNLDWNSPHSNTAIRLKTQPQTVDTSGANFPTFLANGSHLKTDESGYIDFKSGGVPFPHRPTQLSGYYRLIDTLSAIDHFGHCRVLLKKFNVVTQAIDTIAYTDSRLDLSPSLEWKAFQIPIHYQSDVVPDSLVIVFNPSIFADEPAELWLDDLAFTYNPTSTFPTDLISDNLTIYPNPVNDWLYIDPHQKNYEAFRLLDVSGRVLLAGPFKKRIDLRPLDQQFFILQLLSAGGKPRSISVVRQQK
ncbi:MAG: T9SS type A sorting domain-containing protein [Saprospiraceae bacterium]|nr:T9SS type A sorting domain-containing protein [Saprospiraceae bacterium]